MEHENDDELMELYQMLIKEHSKKPKNFGELICDCCHHQKGKNPSCGDEIDLFIKLEEYQITDIKFTGQGCALSIASCSLMTEELKNKNVSEANKIIENFIQNILDENNAKEIDGKIYLLTNVKNFPLRVKCVLLSWRSAENILNKVK